MHSMCAPDVCALSVIQGFFDGHDYNEEATLRYRRIRVYNHSTIHFGIHRCEIPIEREERAGEGGREGGALLRLSVAD